ncbi:MAG: hypothetical protein KJZ47_00840 [Gemmatimonadales bacterium]|nr:hypothetical protein [Gemmatimonadales bacterium]
MPTVLEALGRTPNATQALPHLVTGGQPGEEEFRALREAGVEVILDIRDPMEPRPFDEAQLAGDLGMRYYNVPVVAGRLDDGIMAAVLEILRKEKDVPTLFHCASGNRVGGALIPYLIQDAGMTEDDAIAMAMRVGMRSSELLEWGIDYARRTTAG